MTNEKKEQYKKAHVELYEIINHLTNTEKEKIPKEFIDNLKNNIDNNYTFQFDENKTILEQNLMLETKALLIQMYKKYLAPEEEKRLWDNYNIKCLGKIEKNKRAKYNPDNLFKDKIVKLEKNENLVTMVEYKESIFTRIKNWFKRNF